MEAGTPNRQPLTGNRNALIAVVALVAIIAIGLVLFFVLHKSKHHPKTVLGVGPLAFKTTAGLRAQAVKYNATFYWVGPQPGVRYSFQRTTTNEIFVRYLTAGISVKDLKTPVLTIATYPGSAYKSLHKKKFSLPGPGGSVLWVDPKHRTNVYMAWPNRNVEVEVFALSPRLAKFIAKSGRVKQVR